MPLDPHLNGMFDRIDRMPEYTTDFPVNCVVCYCDPNVARTL
jgi:hypothetical protein